LFDLLLIVAKILAVKTHPPCLPRQHFKHTINPWLYFALFPSMQNALNLCQLLLRPLTKFGGKVWVGGNQPKVISLVPRGKVKMDVCREKNGC
jgi:hypothetical protein